MTSLTIRIATTHAAVCADVRRNGDHLRQQMVLASEAGARLVHFPEAALSGYVKSHIPSWDAVDWSVIEEELDAMAALAARLGIWVVVGCNHRLAPPHRPHNSLYVISDQGAVAVRYHKRLCSHSEVTSWYTPGVHPVVLDVDGFRFGCALCIEVCFPGLFAEYERLGVHCVLFSTFSDDPGYLLMARAHAATNCYWLSLSNAFPAKRLPSALIGPDGNEIVTGRLGCSGMMIGTIDPNAPQYEVPLRHARPWRAKAQAGEIYAGKLP